MSDRTCQLCGKPLSRIRVGGGEEFCSREHRNQYRLRRGMDRLQEANKVASLMRRRENPKAITVSPVATVVWRGYFQPMVNPNRSVQLPHRSGAAKQNIGLPSAGYVRVRPSGDPHRMQPRMLDGGITARAPLSRPLRGRAGQAGRLNAAGAVNRPAAAPDSAAQRRSQHLLRSADPGRVVPPKAGAIRKRTDGAASAAFRAVPLEAQAGALLRVSRSAGFRVRTPLVFPFDRGGPKAAVMAWPEYIRDRAQPCTAPEQSGAITLSIAFPKRPMEPDCRWKPEPVRGKGMRPPQVFPLEISAQDFEVSDRVPGPIWNPDDTPRFLRRSRSPEGVHLFSASGALPLETVPAVQEPAQRISVVPFGSGDITFGYSEEEHSIQ